MWRVISERFDENPLSGSAHRTRWMVWMAWMMLVLWSIMTARAMLAVWLAATVRVVLAVGAMMAGMLLSGMVLQRASAAEWRVETGVEALEHSATQRYFFSGINITPETVAQRAEGSQESDASLVVPTNWFSGSDTPPLPPVAPPIAMPNSMLRTEASAKSGSMGSGTGPIPWCEDSIIPVAPTAYPSGAYAAPQCTTPQCTTPQYPMGMCVEPIRMAAITPVTGRCTTPTTCSSPMTYSAATYVAQNPYPGGYAPNTTGTATGSGIRLRTGDEFSRKFDLLALDVRSDYANYYSAPTAIRMLIAVGIAAPLTNTDLDMNVHNWYQDKVRSSGTDDVAYVVKNFGEGLCMMTLSGGITLAGLALTTADDMPIAQGIGDFGRDTLRAYVVGGPSVLAMQWTLGGERPEYGSTRWSPFSADHAVSGHAFVGAVPFIMLSKHSDTFWEKGFWYFASTLPAWSRINDGAHSFSQAGLGWYMAELSCESVCATNDAAPIQMQFTPVFTTDTTGVMAIFRY